MAQNKHGGVPAYISFQAAVNDTTAALLINVIAQQMDKGHRDIHLLLSTVGGATMSGIAVFHTLRGLPIKLTTHNVGTVNSIGNVIYLAGDTRLACPSSSFMFHGVGVSLQQNARLEEKDVTEKLAQIRNDQGLIARIISDRANIPQDEVGELFLRAAFMPSEQAKQRGIVHEIRDVDVPAGAPFLQLVFQG